MSENVLEETSEEKLLTTSQAAKILHVHPETLRGYAAKGIIECSKTAGGHRRFNASDIEGLKDRIPNDNTPGLQDKQSIHTEPLYYNYSRNNMNKVDKLLNFFLSSKADQAWCYEGRLPYFRKEVTDIAEGEEPTSKEFILQILETLLPPDQFRKSQIYNPDPQRFYTPATSIVWVNMTTRIQVSQTNEMTSYNRETGEKSPGRPGVIIQKLPTFAPSLDDLGSPQYCKKLIQKKEGMIIVSSGHYTDREPEILAAMVREISEQNKRSRRKLLPDSPRSSEKYSASKLIATFDTHPSFIHPRNGYKLNGSNIEIDQYYITEGAHEAKPLGENLLETISDVITARDPDILVVPSICSTKVMELLLTEAQNRLVLITYRPAMNDWTHAMDTIPHEYPKALVDQADISVVTTIFRSGEDNRHIKDKEGLLILDYSLRKYPPR